MASPFGTTWYEHGAAATAPAPPLAGRIDTGTCVVGGGLAGLGTALSLAERGLPVVLLEGLRIGSGASGRNGGMASAGFNRDFAFLLASVGRERAEALYRLSLEGLALLRRRIGEGGIECGLVEGVVAASWFAATMMPSVGQMRRLGARLEPLPVPRMARALRLAALSRRRPRP